MHLCVRPQPFFTTSLNAKLPFMDPLALVSIAHII